MALEGNDKRILCAGLCCVDIISVCDHYPLEDTDQRWDGISLIKTLVLRFGYGSILFRKFDKEFSRDIVSDH